jgi:hypothetical protein
MDLVDWMQTLKLCQGNLEMSGSSNLEMSGFAFLFARFKIAKLAST